MNTIQQKGKEEKRGNEGDTAEEQMDGNKAKKANEKKNRKFGFVTKKT